MDMKEQQERPALLTFLETAQILAVSPQTMRRIIAAEALEPVRIPGLKRPRYRRADVERLIAGEAP
jgi:hypothetical protein